MIVSGSNDCKIKVWSASRGECIQTLTGHDQLVRALSFDPCTGRLVSASYDKSVKVWDLNTGKLITEFKNSHVSHIFDVKFDARRIVRSVIDTSFLLGFGLIPLQHFSRSEDCGAQFLRGAGHRHVRLNALFS
jgi:F-box and WD-40 domain protein 1/11